MSVTTIKCKKEIIIKPAFRATRYSKKFTQKVGKTLLKNDVLLHDILIASEIYVSTICLLKTSLLYDPSFASLSLGSPILQVYNYVTSFFCSALSLSTGIHAPSFSPPLLPCFMFQETRYVFPKLESTYFNLQALEVGGGLEKNN